MLCPLRTSGTKTKRTRNKRKGNEAKNKQMEEDKKKIKSVLKYEQEVGTEAIIPLLKNGQREFDEPQRERSFLISPFVSS